MPLSGAVVELWENELQHCPFDADATLFIAYFASAEMGCFEAPAGAATLPDRPVCRISPITNNGTHDDDDNGLLIDLTSRLAVPKQRHASSTPWTISACRQSALTTSER